MKIYSNKNVFDSALDRIRYIFDEFPTVIVGISGGKDSTVTFQMALIVAKEKNRLPLKVMFVDQEAEWDGTIQTVRDIFAMPEVEPLWYQIPLKIENAASSIDHYLNVWGPGEEWMRPQEEDSIKALDYGTTDFYDIFGAILAKDFPNEPCVYLAGVRAEESPARTIGLTSDATYKWITWGKTLNKAKKHFTFYPLYDWSYTDIWKAIFQNKWAYNPIYDMMYNYGMVVQKMRISSLHHETSVDTLFYLQEFEPDTYNKLVNRMPGINAAGKFGKDDFFVKDLPYMFRDWKDYRDYLLENIIVVEADKELFRNKFEDMDKRFSDLSNMDYLWKAHVATLMVNDTCLTKLTNWERSPEVHAYRNYHRGRGILKLSKLIKKDGKPNNLPKTEA